MRARYVAFVAALCPSFAAAQGSLCNPCVDPGIGAPRAPFRNVVPGPTRTITAEELQSLGVISAADMLKQLPENIRVDGEGTFEIGETLARLRSAQTQAAPGPLLPLIDETTVAAPLDSVWRAWTTSAGLSAWLAPRADVDLRIGGKLRVAYDLADGLYCDTAVENEILAFDRPRMLAFRVTRPPANFPHAAAVAAMWTVVYLDAVSADTTRVRVVVNGLGDDEEGQDARAFFERGNAETLRRLEERFGTPQ